MATAIVNGFGRTLGDSIIGLQALKLALEEGALDPNPTLFRLPGLSPLIEDAYRAAADLCAVAELPWADATRDRPFAPAAFDRVIDIRDFAFDPTFRGVAMIDWFLTQLGADPAAIPSARKRNTWLAPRLTPAPPPAPPGYALLCPRTANPMRDMPDPIADAIAARLTAHGLVVLSQATLPRANNLAELAGLVAGAAAVVSADTAMIHLADALDRPCLAFFTTHRPAWRVRDYPRCHAIDLAAAVPDALEFVRDDADIAACRAAWSRAPLAATLDRFLETTHG